ncbi:transcription elongation factor GreA [Neolewinella aurantiaca]|uniref:Transcription elongation factor GreA n=1 Tax=Neolewinella aurantiaca TaxID=2602767 RepID=A0A5C7FES5_9BACT|nr:GreA/GreB family elongation factor [Neolewinella aurantiaca]TXF88758.1 transcription elongation factor GreA [Neolewinella aurantiaca]
MSRGFVKESDQEELPLIPERAPLPSGTTNYVTPAGLTALEKERAELEAAKDTTPTENEDEHRRALTVLDGKLALLQKRIATARVINPDSQPANEVRFGATVKMRMGGPSGRIQEFQIVGVDEANVKAKKIAFTAPIAKAITGLWVGESADFRLGGENRKLEVLEIRY